MNTTKLSDFHIIAKNIENLIKVLSSSKVYIYGAGNAGKSSYELLMKLGIEVEAFMDKKADKDSKLYMGKPILKTSDESILDNIDKNSIIILGFLCDYEEIDSIRHRFLKLGYEKFYYFHEIYDLVSINNFIKSEFKNYKINKDIFKIEEQKIMKIGELLADNKSKNVYYNFIEATFSLNFKLFSKPDTEKQYFVDDILFQKGYSSFIDCGAFDGDTAIELYRLKGKIDKIALFEPEGENYKKLSYNLNKNPVASEQILFPCGVWNKSHMLKFKSGIQGSSSISSEGDSYIQCVALDDALRNFKPTFIKMDIEGSEYEALLGAENIIKEYTPDLAISIYHKIEHIWKIPALIKGFNDKYKFYLRCHGVYGMETILYAVCEK